jgi:hypothetical protein
MSTLTSGDILHYQIPTGGIMQPTSLTVSDTFSVHGQHVNGFNIDSKVFAQMTAPPVTSTSISTSTTPTSNSATATSASFRDTPVGASSSSAPLVSSSSQPLESNKEKSSTAAVAVGVGVGSGLAVLLLAGTGVWFWRRRRRNREGEFRIGSDAEVEGLNAGLRGNEALGSAKASESPMRMVDGELSAERRIGELDAGGNGNGGVYWDPVKRSSAAARVYEI